MSLDKYLKENGIARKKFAKKIGVTHQAITNYCNGYPPKRSVALKIQKITNGDVTLADLWSIKVA